MRISWQCGVVWSSSRPISVLAMGDARAVRWDRGLRHLVLTFSARMARRCWWLGRRRESRSK